jgi:hypothetical protein
MFQSQMRKKARDKAGGSRGFQGKSKVPLKREYLDDSLCIAVPEKANGDGDASRKSVSLW